MENMPEEIGRLRKQYRSLVASRGMVEDRLLRSRQYCKGSIATVAHHNKDGSSTPYYYISCTRDGKPSTVYIRRNDLARTRKQVGNWQAFKRDLARLQKLNRDIAGIVRQIVELQTVEEVKNDQRGAGAGKRRQTRTTT